MKEKTLTLNLRDQQRIRLLNRLLAGELSMEQAAQQAGKSPTGKPATERKEWKE